MIVIANYSHKWWYYAISVILIIATLLLLIYSPFHRANALVASGVVIAAVLAALAAFGITTVVSGMTSSQVSDYLDGKLSEWATYKGSTIENLIQGNLITKTATNLFAIGASAANGIREFIDWLKTDESITDNSIVTVVNYTGNFVKVNSTQKPETVAELIEVGVPIYSYVVANKQIIQYCASSIELYICSYINGNNYYYIAISDQSLSGVSYYAASTASRVAEYNLVNSYNSANNLNYSYIQQNSGNSVTCLIPQYTSLGEALSAFNNDFALGYSLDLNAGTIEIPSTIANEDNLYLDVGASSVADVSGLADWVLDEVEANSLSASYEVETAPPAPTVDDINIESISTGAISSIQSAVQSAIQSAIQQSETIQVNTDHHILGFTLPSFDLHLSGIWHYVHDAVGTASTFINFLKGMLTSVPWLAIPLYMSFTLIVVLGVFRRFLL